MTDREKFNVRFYLILGYILGLLTFLPLIFGCTPPPAPKIYRWKPIPTIRTPKPAERRETIDAREVPIEEFVRKER